MPRKWYEGRITKILNESDNTKRFFIEVDDDQEFSFLPGQFITLDLPIGEKRLERWRSYSIANIPNKKNIIELCVVKLEGGAAGNWFFNIVEKGTKVTFKGPEGSFVLPESIEKNLVFICTGTGVAPFRSMIKYLEMNGIGQKNVHLIFGTRYANGILYKQEWDEMVEKYIGFEVSYALSREKKNAYHNGYVHDIYLQEYSDKKLEDYLFYICGWSQMVDEAVERLVQEMQVPKENIRFELYG